MLRKFVGISDVGTFRNAPASRDVEMKKLTLIHGENGRGKTTLCAIIRSLKSGDANLVLERKTIDSAGSPRIKLMMDSGPVDFKDGAWSLKHEQIEVFDANFVAENVYSGDLITHDNKRNLSRIVLGNEGVKLAEEFDALDGKVRSASTSIGGAREVAERYVPKGMTLEAYLKLEADGEIDKKIEDKKDEIERVKASDAIRSRSALVQVTLPQPPATMTDTLERTIEGVSADAENKINEHLAKHNMRSSNWLGEGMRFATDECPFCAQDLMGSEIFGAIRDFFNQSYRDFQNELARFRSLVMDPLSDTSLLRIQKSLSDNISNGEFWERYAPAPAGGHISFDDRVRPVIVRLRDALAPLVAQKLATPMEAVKHSAESLAAMAEWTKLRHEVTAYNAEITTYNATIDEVKRTISVKPLATLNAELASLEAKKKRFEKEAVLALYAYTKAQADKAAIEIDKEKAREALNKYNEKVIGKYQQTVNDLLERFGTSFRLGKVEVETSKRTPRISYTFTLRGVEIEPGGDSTPAGVPCFGNTLSAGDKSTLALAFFIAQLKTRDDTKDLVVVFDDPFTSLDSFRQTWTCNSIRAIAQLAKQVIVFSHSLDFLRLVADRCDKANLKSLKIDVFNKDDSRIFELDLEDATAKLTDKDVIKLRNFCTGDDADAPGAIRTIRPLLENHIRKMAPDDCPEGNGWLGNFLGDIQKADDASTLAQFKPMYEVLDCLNSYTAPYAHDDGNAPAIDGTELRTNGKLTLKLIGRTL